MDIREALSSLDSLNDEHWTSDGLPKIDAVKELLGRPVARQEIIDAAPKFTRQNTDLTLGDDDGEEELKASDGGPAQEQEDEAQLVDLADFAGSEPTDVNTFLSFLDRVPTGQLQELKETLDKQKQSFRDMRYKLDEYERRVNGAVTMVKARIQREIPDISDREANQAYLRSQADQRAKKKAYTNEVLQGIKLSDLDPRAPVDRAFARKTSRGVKRPGT